jgi:hypothetical protein
LVEKGKFINGSDLEVLRLLRAFAKIGDPKRRREIIDLAEKLATPPVTDVPLHPDKPPNEADQ